MRVRYGQLSVQEELERERVLERARVAWYCLREGDDARACQLMEQIDERLQLTVRQGPEGDRCAELTPLEASVWPLTELILQQAPAELGCTLALGRMAVPLADALAEVLASHELDLGGASLRAGFGRGHLLEITLSIAGGSGSEIEQNAAENLVRAVVGDRMFETWVGAVHATPAPRRSSLRVLDVSAPRTTLQLHELFDTVAAATLGVLQGLPEQPRADTSETRATHGAAAVGADDEARGDWTLLETEPVEGALGVRKDDLVLASTCTPELLRCYLDGAPCASRRFSRVGECFVFVSYEDHERTMRARVARRAAMEAALREAVSGFGAVTGVGFGVKTTYVDLALCNLETGLARLVSKLKELDAPARTFVQFFDSELADEWLSIWPDSRLTEG